MTIAYYDAPPELTKTHMKPTPYSTYGTPRSRPPRDDASAAHIGGDPGPRDVNRVRQSP